MTKNKNKVISRVKTGEGRELKVWVNRKMGTVLPTNWKLQAGFLSQNKQ